MGKLTSSNEIPCLLINKDVLCFMNKKMYNVVIVISMPSVSNQPTTLYSKPLKHGHCIDLFLSLGKASIYVYADGKLSRESVVFDIWMTFGYANVRRSHCHHRTRRKSNLI